MQLDLLPGTMCDERVWSRLVPHLDAAFFPNYISLAGPHDRESIRRTLLERTASSSHLVGFSMGGYLALEHAMAHPERVASLVVIAASARGLNEQEKQRRQLVLKHVRERGYSGMPMAQVLSLLGSASHKDAEAIALMREMDRELGKETLLSQLTATMDRPDLTAALGSLTCPTLLIGAREDTLARPEELESMRQTLLNGRLAVFDCGHMIPLEAPEALGREMAAFYAAL